MFSCAVNTGRSDSVRPVSLSSTTELSTPCVKNYKMYLNIACQTGMSHIQISIIEDFLPLSCLLSDNEDEGDYEEQSSHHSEEHSECCIDG